jgi:hypothetical protein
VMCTSPLKESFVLPAPGSPPSLDVRVWQSSAAMRASEGGWHVLGLLHRIYVGIISAVPSRRQRCGWPMEVVSGFLLPVGHSIATSVRQTSTSSGSLQELHLPRTEHRSIEKKLTAQITADEGASPGSFS